MANTDLMKELTSLVQLDIDAIHAYDQAMQNVDIVEVKNKLGDFKQDHQRHVNDLSECIRRMGGEPPSFSPDFKGFIIQGFTALRSMMGTEGALKAMRSNEMLTNRNYESALTFEMPDEIRAIVKRNREDERRHLDYIEQAINNRVWEGARRVA